MKTLVKILLFSFVAVGLTMTLGCSQPSSGKSQVEFEDGTIVQTQTGKVQGVQEGEIVSFKGIPFAKPPVGELRFAPPEKATSWEGILECSEYRECAVQVDEGQVVGSEDCLYLNIWAPVDAANKELPVYVYIHGGAFAMGSPSKATYEGTRFAQDGIIQVNIAYRLGGLGFLSSEELEENYGYLGNAGMLDQIAGLQWVQDNIAAFGGDPSNVTVGGESAGAFSVSNLIVSPLAKGLFNRAIMESGNVLGQPLGLPQQPGDRETALQTSENLMEYLGAKSISDMRALSAEEITQATAFNLDMTDPSPYYQWPVFDGVVLPQNPYESLKKNEVNGVPILAGFNSDEGTMFVPEGISEQTYIEYVERIFADQSAEILTRYPVDDQHAATDCARYLFKMALRMGSDVFVDELSSYGHDAYFYEFSFSTPQLEELGLGTSHALELPFVFDAFPESVVLDEETKTLKESIHNYWLNFIRTGNPNSEAEVLWPKYSVEAKNKMKLDNLMESSLVDDADEVSYFVNLFWNS